MLWSSFSSYQHLLRNERFGPTMASEVSLNFLVEHRRVYILPWILAIETRTSFQNSPSDINMWAAQSCAFGLSVTEQLRVRK
jgi:hypothetical protein